MLMSLYVMNYVGIEFLCIWKVGFFKLFLDRYLPSSVMSCPPEFFTSSHTRVGQILHCVLLCYS